jgi:LmbE family N-acetylglucosaminyl deacetylase
MDPIAPDLARQLDVVLCVGAHADDIEIGCAGTLLQLARANPALRFTWVVLSGNQSPINFELAHSAQLAA